MARKDRQEGIGNGQCLSPVSRCENGIHFRIGHPAIEDEGTTWSALGAASNQQYIFLRTRVLSETRTRCLGCREPCAYCGTMAFLGSDHSDKDSDVRLANLAIRVLPWMTLVPYEHAIYALRDKTCSRNATHSLVVSICYAINAVNQKHCVMHGYQDLDAYIVVGTTIDVNSCAGPERSLNSH